MENLAEFGLLNFSQRMSSMLVKQFTRKKFKGNLTDEQIQDLMDLAAGTKSIYNELFYIRYIMRNQTSVVTDNNDINYDSLQFFMDNENYLYNKLDKKLYLQETYPLLVNRIKRIIARTERARARIGVMMQNGFCKNDRDHFLLSVMLFLMDDWELGMLVGAERKFLGLFELDAREDEAEDRNARATRAYKRFAKRIRRKLGTPAYNDQIVDFVRQLRMQKQRERLEQVQARNFITLRDLEEE